MKCRSVACIWSGSPPLHKVTATAVLNQPPTLYTGGSDGAIIWWNLSGTTDSNQEIKPVAMLCGHAAPIADLGICYPVVAGDGKIDNSNNVAAASGSSGALISACTEGVLCVWSRVSGHCRRRRKMPPWVGSPSVVQVVPSNKRYVCIACSFIDALYMHDHHTVESTEGGESSVERESQYRKPSKCTVVIVDTYSLTLVHTVFHGNLSIGSLMFMAVISSIEEREKQFALLVDSIGEVQLVPVSIGPNPDGEGGAGLQRSSSHKDMSIWADMLGERGQVVSISTSGQILAIVYKTCCIFRSMASGTIIGEISFKDTCLCFEGNSHQSHVVGGMFLVKDDLGNTFNTRDLPELVASKFAVWNNKGAAVVYIISYLNDLIKLESLCELPAVAHALDMRLSICIVQLNSYLLRIESRCIHVEDPLMWRPLVTIWSLHQQNSDQQLCQLGKMLGEGSLFVDWITNSGHPLKTEDLRHSDSIEFTSDVTESHPQESSVSSTNYVNNICQHDENFGLGEEARVVTSSMVISESFYTPYAVVYGLYSGDIEVVRFDVFFQGLRFEGGSPHVFKQYFSGHTGAVLCLAAHRVAGISRQGSFNHVLLSGSMDSTIRIWDLDTGNMIRVMHQHVAPVRQIILPPAGIERPWSDCFLSVGEDSCVALASLETLRVERMFPGHPNYPTKVVWDGARGYIACLCQNTSGTSDAIDVLFIWDIKTGARERVLRGTASHSMFDNFCKGINLNSLSGSVLNGNTSVSSLILPVLEDEGFTQSHLKRLAKGVNSSNMAPSKTYAKEAIPSQEQASTGDTAKRFLSTLSVLQSKKHPINCSCPFPGIASLSFDLASLMSPQKQEFYGIWGDKQVKNHLNEQEKEGQNPDNITTVDQSERHETLSDNIEDQDLARSLESCLFRFTLSLLHLWNVDSELDNLLITDMKLKRPEKFIVASGLQGDRGSLTLTFPGLSATLEMWKSSSEFGAMRSLMMVSLAQRVISLSHFNTAASSALAAFYTRNFAERIPAVKPPLLQLLVSFWQDESEHVRMAARSLFHCAASRAIPLPLCSKKTTDHGKYVISTDEIGKNEHQNANIEETSTSELDSELLLDTTMVYQVEEFNILAWLESYEMQDWISCIGGTSQDAMTSHIIVAAALAIWYPSLVKPSLPKLVVHPLMKLVMAMNEKYTSTAAELLAEGMESTWKACIGSEIPHLIEDIFFQIECLSGASANLAGQNPAVPVTVQETLVGILLPSLATADISGFLTVIESQIWSTASDSPVHLVSLTTLIRLIRGSPRNLVQYLDKAVNFILQTIHPGNSVMRKTCLQSSMTALKDVARVFPMVALNDTLNRLAVGDAIGDIQSASIRVYDMQSVMKTKILDASGPPGLPSLLSGASETVATTAISALSFSPDGEGLVAFSEHGLMIRWWSLGSAWWEKLSRNLIPVQCTKLIFVPPWEGFSPNSSRSSIMDSIMGHDRQANLQVNLIGGYYDAGDNVKFGWPMAFSVSLLSWAAVEYKSDISSANQLGYLRGAIKWGADFILQAHPSPTTLYTQVGDGNGDHQCWERPEDMNTPRTLYKITSSSPGSEAAAEAAAALSSASIVFKDVDSNYSARLLGHSKSLFEFADKYKGSFQNSCPFYCSYSGYQDELLWAAAWLYKATGETKYLDYVTSNQGWSQPVSEFSWDNKFVGAQTLLAKEFFGGKENLKRFKSDADSFICALMPGSSSLQIRTTPGGLLYTRDSSNLQYVTSSTMVLFMYSTALSASHVDGVQCGSAKFSASQIKAFAKSQVDYILGNNPMKMSYMVGFGSKYPKQLHHRGASIPSIHDHPAKVGCNDGYSSYYSSSNPNPNTHVGAVVGGPNSNDQYNDARSDYSHAEPTTYMNAAFVGSVASLLRENKEESCMELLQINQTKNMVIAA